MPPPSALTGSVRTCVGCGAVAARGELTRLSLDESSVPTLARRGRGAHVHARPRCITGAAKRGLSRSFRREVRVADTALASMIVAAARETVRLSLARAARAQRQSDLAVEGVHHARLASRIANACATIDALRVMSVSEVG